MNEQRTDVAIVGGGPIGIELAIALDRAGVDNVVIEAGQVGATFEWWAPGTRFFSSPERIEIAGAPLVNTLQDKATREEYLAYLRSVMLQHRPTIRSYERVERIERATDGFSLRSSRSRHGVGGPAEMRRAPADQEPVTWTTHARRVVLAIGNMHRPRRLDVPGEDLPHVSHYFDDPHRYFGRRVLIVGGKNSAVEAALRCYRCGSDVTISYRGDTFDPKRVKYWLRPEIEWLIAKERIGWLPRTMPQRIESDGVRLVSVDDPAVTHDVTADFVLLLTGYVQDQSLFEQLGVAREGDEQAPRVDRKTMETDVPGVYVAGTALEEASAGARIFLENSHVHVERIVRAVTGRPAEEVAPSEYVRLEES